MTFKKTFGDFQIIFVKLPVYQDVTTGAWSSPVLCAVRGSPQKERERGWETPSLEYLAVAVAASAKASPDGGKQRLS